MTTISVDEFIYTRVESGVGGRQVGGYQPAHASPGITRDEAAELTLALCSFKLSIGERCMFAALRTGRFAVARLGAAPGHTRYMDSAGRDTFIAHAVVLDAEIFRSIGCNPYSILDHFPFVRDGLRLGEDYLDHPPAGRTIDIGPPREPRGDIPRDTLRTLLASASRAAEPREPVQGVEILGSPADVLDTLRAVFAYTSENDRAACTFDTCVDGLKQPLPSLWAVGTEGGLRESSRILVRPGAPSDDAPEFRTALYYQWLRAHSTGNADFTPPPVELALAMDRLARAWGGEHPGAPDGCTPDHVRRLIAHVPAASERVFQKLRALEPEIGPHLWARVVNAIGEEVMLKLVCGELPLQELARALRAPLHDPGVAVRRHEWKTIQALARRAEDWVLLHWAAVATECDADRKEALARMSADDFRVTLDAMGRLVRASDCVVETHWSELLARLDPTPPDEAEIIRVAIAALEAGCASQMAPLVKLLRAAPPASRKRVMKAAARLGAELPQEVRDALAPPSPPATEAGGFLNRLAHAFQLKPKG